MSRLRPLRALSVALRVVRLTNRGSTFLVLGGAALVAGYAAGMPILLYSGCFALALPLMAAVLVRSRESALSVSRQCAFPVVEAGTTSLVTVRVDNHARTGLRGAHWADGLPWSPWATASGWMPPLSARVGGLNQRSAAQLSYSLTPRDRGIFEIGPLLLQSSDPLSLALGSWSVGAVTELTVTPRVVTLAQSALLAQSGDGEARVLQRRSAGDDDDAMTREYRRGDAMRRVHWRASARHGSLMVRQEEQHSYPEARIIVDTRIAGYPDASRNDSVRLSSGAVAAAARSPRFEWVVSMLASAAVQLKREGFLVEIIETGPSQLADASIVHRRAADEHEFLTRLATFGPVDSAPGWWGEPVPSTSAGGPVLALVAHPEPETVSYLRRQALPGVLAVAFVVESSSSFGDFTRSGDRARQPAGDELRDAGWKVISVQSFDDVGDAWTSFVAESRAHRDNN
ncbi:DUF58 domain-containing protein [Salinibacterium sp. SWN248]|uniref:DUF58 domain-containing protein n=1 Tax=Salinibacterium sp. SWN248 TaxID=2792056 RepID=UPI0018CCBEA7|nr:DUF58 domain-containing protein [Salinibacterium sp. SWN248]MBH0023682.1 DUF58 domain-containing protein [Salinibacterium sp. SWN248]